MSISPWYVGDTAPLMTIQLVPDTGFVDVTGLSASSFTLAIHNVNTGTEATGQGTFVNVVAAIPSGGTGTIPASVQYQFALADITVGLFHLYLKVQFGSRQQTFDLGAWQVTAS